MRHSDRKQNEMSLNSKMLKMYTGIGYANRKNIFHQEWGHYIFSLSLVSVEAKPLMCEPFSGFSVSFWAIFSFYFPVLNWFLISYKPLYRVYQLYFYP